MANVQSAEVVLPCRDVQATVDFFTARLGFRLDAIFPADDPAVALVSGHGLRLRLERGRGGAPGVLRLLCADPAAVGGGEVELLAPNGTRVELVAANPAFVVPVPRPAFAVQRMGPAATFGKGRAGMRYRDLLPGRLSGFLVASQIRIETGGPVPDLVHYHELLFQLIYCRRGWVRVVYEDQGPPFVLGEGDCVLQPPRIRHRVLESSPGLEVIELGAPAAHETRIDHELELPTSELRPERDFGGQSFVRHQRAGAAWHPWHLAGFEARDLGIERASGGLACVHVARVSETLEPAVSPFAAAFRFLFVLQGTTVLTSEGHPREPLHEGDSVLLPAGWVHRFDDSSRDLELLEAAFASPAREP